MAKKRKRETGGGRQPEAGPDSGLPVKVEDRAPAEEGSKVRGILAITAKGFGFVKPESSVSSSVAGEGIGGATIGGGATDIFIALEHLGTALDGDTVEVRLSARAPQGKLAGEVVRVLERSKRTIVGVFRGTPEGGRVYPEDERLPAALLIPRTAVERAGLGPALRDGQVVIARLDAWERRKAEPIGSVVHIVGDQDEPGIDVKTVALANDLALDFPPEALRQADRTGEPDLGEQAAGRLDLRELACYTVDPPGAQDIDDALSVRQLPGGLFEIGVHIADVSFFVPEGSPVDREARRRATAVYFVRRSLPMLPPRISAGLCSLQPGAGRLAFSLLARVDSSGTVHGARIAPSLVRSRRRFSYGELQAILEGSRDELAADVRLLHLLTQALRRRRQERGSLDLDLPRPIILLDGEGIPREIRPAERLEAHRMVEECMLLANRAVAGQAEGEPAGARGGARWPFIYRVHRTPLPEDVQVLLRVLDGLGIPYRVGGRVSPEDYRAILSIIQNLELKDYVEKVALRSLSRAEYSTRNEGHFSLAFPAYTHFTSPLRRYADLAVHRLLRRYGSGAGGPGEGAGEGWAAPRREEVEEGAGPGRGEPEEPLRRRLEALCEHCNRMERVAARAEGEYRRIKSLEFLSRKVGNIYEGVISGVASFGLFVELKRYLVEGLVPVSSLGRERFDYDGERFQLASRRTGRSWRLGDRVTVRVRRVSVPERQAEFRLV